MQVREAKNSPVHPRACGERFVYSNAGDAWAGSSPRMRGTDGQGPFRPDARRFIPAHAGNGFGGRAARSPVSVHPRACGERWVGIILPVDDPGSSPRMRGTVRRGFSRSALGRFIPARAGNGQRRAVHTTVYTVHPRACGERLKTRVVQPSKIGSSPRVRGTVKMTLLKAFSKRFIPAHAGNGCRLSKMWKSNTVHPRACGERDANIMGNAWYLGSSPRMRGTAAGRAHGFPEIRFIPARAGNGSPLQPLRR